MNSPIMHLSSFCTCLLELINKKSYKRVYCVTVKSSTFYIDLHPLQVWSNASVSKLGERRREKRRWKQEMVLSHLSLWGTDSNKHSKTTVGCLTALTCSILPTIKLGKNYHSDLKESEWKHRKIISLRITGLCTLLFSLCCGFEGQTSSSPAEDFRDCNWSYL